MAEIFLHDHPEFPDLVKIVGAEMKIEPALIEKDYWIMHCLYGLQRQGYRFQLKGGTSLSKGFHIINRFSEDIDIHIEPPEQLGINQNPKNNKPANVERKRNYYDQLARDFNIHGITSIERDHAFDNPDTYNSGGIRLNFPTETNELEGLKKGVLLEVGFDTVSPTDP